MNSKYEMFVNQNDQVFDIQLKGFFQEQDAKEFVQDYMTHTQKINAKSSSMIIDCVNLPIIKAELIPDLQNCYKLYASSGFKNIVFINSNSTLQHSQLKRVADSVGLKCHFTKSRGEALNIIKGK